MNMTYGWLDLFSGLAFSFEWGQAAVMCEFPKDWGIVDFAQPEWGEIVQGHGPGFESHMKAGWTLWVSKGSKPRFS